MNFVQVHDTRVTIPWLWQENAPTVQVRTYDGTLRSKYKAALFKCSFVAFLFVLVMPGIGECNPPIPEGPFPLSQSSRAQGLQEVGQRRVRTVKRKLVEAIVSQAGEEL